MDDLIRRQSLIDILEKEMDACNMPDERPVRFGLRMARNFVQDMPSAEPKSHVIANIAFDEEKLKEICANALQEIKPSAQPEIIRCKDCKWWTKQKDSLQGRCALFGMYPTGEWYCANAKMEVEHDN